MGRLKISVTEAAEIIRELEQGATQTAVAKKHSITQPYVSTLWKRRAFLRNGSGDLNQTAQDENSALKATTAGVIKALQKFLSELSKRTPYQDPDYDKDEPIDYKKAAVIYVGTAIEMATNLQKIIGEDGVLTKQMRQEVNQAAQLWNELTKGGHHG
jgi:transposase-like protein